MGFSIVKVGRLTAKVSSKDIGLISGFKWHVRSSGNMKYAGASAGGSRILMHRLILGTQFGLYVDHINHDGLDNRRENLRECTHAQNMANRRPTGTSRFLGVRMPKDKPRFQAQIGGTKLGYFDSEIWAALAYDFAASIQHGEFANLNFPEVCPSYGEIQSHRAVCKYRSKK